jgi:glycosyltransferase involved in cell wall biosynthesis
VYTKKGAGLADILKRKNITRISVVEVGFGIFWKDIGLFFQPRMDAYIFHGPMVPFLFAPKNYFVILHDLAYKYIFTTSLKEKIKRYTMDMLTRGAFRRAKKVISVSDATKYDLVRFFGVSFEKIQTIYQGFEHIQIKAGTPIREITEPFFLFIGTIKERKNVLSVIRAFALYKKRNEDKQMLVIVGKQNKNNPYVQSLYEEIRKHSLDKSVIFTNHISDAERTYVYAHADALVFPSLLEGFGIPVLEAMSARVPVITSNTGALAEVAGDAALLVDPRDVEDISAAMETLVKNRELRDQYIKKGIERIRLFDWSNTARAIERLVIDCS